MAKNGITELVFIIDRSGSMAGTENDTIGGFNSTLEKQKKEEGTAYVTTYTFSSSDSMIHDRLKVEDVNPLTEDDYRVGGNTALFDAIGHAIHHIGNIHKYARPEDVPEHTVFVIITDGMENASRNYSKAEIKQKIKTREQENGWQFIFLSADLDALEEARSFGINPTHSTSFVKSKEGMSNMFMTMNMVVSNARKGKDTDINNK